MAHRRVWAACPARSDPPLLWCIGTSASGSGSGSGNRPGQWAGGSPSVRCFGCLRAPRKICLGCSPEYGDEGEGEKRSSFGGAGCLLGFGFRTTISSICQEPKSQPQTACKSRAIYHRRGLQDLRWRRMDGTWGMSEISGSWRDGKRKHNMNQ